MKLTLRVNEKELEMASIFIVGVLGTGNGFHKNKGEWKRLYGEGREAMFGFQYVEFNVLVRYAAVSGSVQHTVYRRS